MIVAYSSGVWAYYALPVIIRGYYSLSLCRTPVYVGMVIVGFNVLVSLSLIWPLGELGLAVATSLAAAVQTIILAVFFTQHASALSWGSV